MQEVSTQEGKTVLFVSHQMQTIKSLTERCLLFSNGKIIFDGETQKAINFYLENQVQADLMYEDSENLNQTKIIKVQLSTTYKNNVQESGDSLTIELSVFAKEIIKKARFGIGIHSQTNERILFLQSDDPNENFVINLQEGFNKVNCKIPVLHLYKGIYSISIHFVEYYGGRKFQTLNNICPFEVTLINKPDRNNWQKDLCYYFEDHEWEINKTQKYYYNHQIGFRE